MNFLPAASLHTHLLVLVAAVALPLGALVAYHVDRLNEDALAAVGDEAQDAAEAVATDLDRFLERSGKWMQALSQRPELATLDPARCGAVLADFIDLHRRYAGAATLDAQGRIVCLATADGVEMKGEVSAADRDWFRSSLRDDRLQIDGPLIWRVTGKRVVALSRSVQGPDGRRGVIALGVDLAEIQAGLERFGFPAETLVAVTDGAGRVLARTRDAEAWFGRPFDAPSARAYTTRANEKILRGVGADGVERAHAAAAVPTVGWQVRAGIPVAAVLAANRQALFLNYAAISALSLGLLALALWLRRRILASVEALAAAARAVAAGDVAVRVEEPALDDMRDVARQFNAMLEVRQEAERRLRKSEEKFRTLVQQVPAITYMAAIDRNFSTTYISPQIASLGFAPEEWLSDPGLWARQLHPADRERVLETIERAIADGGEIDCEYRLLDRAGGEHWFRDAATVVEGEAGRARQLLGVMLDITERKRAEMALREGEERLRRVSDNASVGLVRCSRDWRYLSANQAYARIAGRPLDRIVGHPHVEVMGVAAVEAIRPHVERALRGEHVVYESYVPFSASGPRYLHVSYTPDIDATGMIVGWVACVTDITERKHMEEELAASHAQLRALAQHLEAAREAERTRIAREVHDELGQALTGLKLDLALLARQLPPAAPAAAQQIEAMNRLIDETVQTVRRISYELRPGVLDALGLAAAVEWQCREFEARSGIACRVDQPEQVAADAARATALFRILQELLTNVARHAGAGAVAVRLEAREGRLILSVADDGVGLGAQARDARESLGLLGMRERAEQFGGRVEIDSAPGRGTRVTVDIPLAESAQ